MGNIRKKLLDRISSMSREQIIFALGIITGAVILVGVGGGILREQRQKYHTEQKLREAQEREKELVEQIEKKKERALKESGYEAELRELYEQNPKLEKMLLHMDEYEPWLVEYLVKNPETMDWVLDYPEQVSQGDEALRQRALEPVELERYEVRNGIPLFFQWDEQWGYCKYGEGRMAVTGCAPTCLSMVAIGLTNDCSITPKRVAELSEELHTYVEGKGTSWELMNVGAKKLGLHSKQIENWSAKAFCSELQKGRVVICSMGEGDFTQRGHFIVMTALTEEGKVLVNDPNSRKNSEIEWEPDTLLKQMKGMWVLYR